jgi:hypothetical protein
LTLDDASHIREPEIATLVSIGEAFMVEAHQGKQRGVKIVDMHPAFHGRHADLVG